MFTRVITDGSNRFDEIAPGYSGPLYLEVVPLSFPVRVKEDLTLNQLRLSMGRPGSPTRRCGPRTRVPMLYRAGEPCRPTTWSSSDGLFLGLDLRATRTEVGHRPATAPPARSDPGGEVDPRPFWDAVYREAVTGWSCPPTLLPLDVPRGGVLPPNLAAEMTAYDPTSGELRTHYAGFFDPGFGFDPTGDFKGSRAALEVRAHDVPFMVENGQSVCKLTFERMLEEPEALYGSGIGSSYQQQVETLSRYFRRTP